MKNLLTLCPLSPAKLGALASEFEGTGWENAGLDY